MGAKYEHLEALRKKIASRAANKKESAALASLWIEFDACLSQFSPSCEKDNEVLEKLRSIQRKIKLVISGEETKDV